MKDTARLKLAVKSRQIGWTWATGYGLVRRKSVKGATLDAWISSRDEIQARLFLEDCKGFGDLLHVGARDLGESVIDERGNSAFVLSLANGLRLHSMSSNPDAQAGKRGDRVLDEFALHPDPRKLYAIAYPGITWGGSMEIFSTPRGSNSFFQTLIDEIADGNPKHFSFHRITLEDALNQGFLSKLQKKLPPGDERQDMDEQEYFDFIKDGCSDEESFNQEYMCVAADDDGAFIEYELIDRCKIRGEGLTGVTDKKKAKGKWISEWRSSDPIGNGPLYLGWDLAKVNDLSVVWMAEDVAGRLVSRRVKAMHKVDFSEQYEEVDEYMSTPNVVRMCLDSSGMGERPYEEMRAKYGGRGREVHRAGEGGDGLQPEGRHGGREIPHPGRTLRRRRLPQDAKSQDRRRQHPLRRRTRQGRPLRPLLGRSPLPRGEGTRRGVDLHAGIGCTGNWQLGRWDAERRRHDWRPRRGNIEEA